jgi:hypothetical protein
VDSSNEPGHPGPSPLGEVAAYAALSQIARGDRPLDQVLEEVAALATRALPETAQASVTLLTDEQPRTAASSGEIALRLDQRQYDDRYGRCLDAAVSGGTIEVAMDDPAGPYPEFRQSARREGITHSLSVSVPAAGRVTAALNLYSSTGSFSRESARIAGTVAGGAGLALASSGRDADAAAAAVQLQQALASRVVINQAQGVLMTRLHCSREQAFTRLIGLADEQGVRLREAARTVVDEATRPS